MDQYKTLAEFQAAVNDINLMGQETHINLALIMARDLVFEPKFGGRAGIPKLLVLITDGMQTERDGFMNPGKVYITTICWS